VTDLEFRNVLGRGRVLALLLTLLLTTLVVPARAEATATRRPHATSHLRRHRARPHAAAPLRRHQRATRRRHAGAAFRRHRTAILRPHVATLVPDPPLVSGRSAGRRHLLTARPATAPAPRMARSRRGRHRAAAARHRSSRTARHRAGHRARSARPASLARRARFDLPRSVPIARRYEPTLTFSAATGSGAASRSPAIAHPRHRFDPHGAARRPITDSRRKPERVVDASALTVSVTISPPESSFLPPGGGEGFATGAGGASAGATGTAVLALAGLALVVTLLLGLLSVDVLPWQSAIPTLRLERPG
jgi:hypothetical protein